MNNFKKITLGLVGATILSLGLNACSNDEIMNVKEENEELNVAYREGVNIYKVSIDNGLDGDILYFSNAEAYDQMEDRLYEDTQNYIATVMESVSQDWSDEEQDLYLNSINFDEDKFYKEFENLHNFSSLRKAINTEYDQWLSEQVSLPDDENNVNDPDNHPLVLEEQRTLFNKGGEIIVGSNTGEAIIYKIFDWGSLEVKNFDTKILKSINIEKLKSQSEILSLIEGNTNYKVILNNKSELTGCASGFVHKKYNYSATGRQVKSITKETGVPFSSFRQLVAKTVGFRYSKRKGYYRENLWLVTGITGDKNSPDVDSPLRRFCGDEILYAHKKATSVKTKKHTRRLKNNAYNNHGLKVYDNATYSYHGEGQFVFTKDFHPPHEINVIHNQ